MDKQQHITAGPLGAGVHLNRPSARCGDHDRASLRGKCDGPIAAAAIDDEAFSRMALGVFTLPEELKHTWTLGVVMAITSKALLGWPW
jgi:hypothetical protein